MASVWAVEQERHILANGVHLTATQLSDAKLAGVAHPTRVRLLRVEQVPPPDHPVLRAAAESMKLITPATPGLALRYGIFIRSACWGQRRVLVRELAHTAQYERLGGFEPFLDQYLRECITPPGYPFGALEQEAERIESDLCGQA